MFRKYYSVFIVAFTASIIFVLIRCEDQVATIKSNHRQCVQDTEVEEADVYRLQQGDFRNNSEPVQLYVFCMFLKAGIITADGTFLMEEAMAKFPDDADKDAVSKAMEKCVHIKGNSPHETAFLIAKCYFEYNPDEYFN